MGSAIDCIGVNKCIGCFACSDACPSNAIELKLDDQGFWLPIVSDGLCTDCGICNRHCPVLNQSKKGNWGKDDVIAYAGWSTDDDIRLRSSSGGIFSEIAANLISQGWYVYGASWDESMKLSHVKIREVSGLDRLRGSKYIQSNLMGVHNEIKFLLSAGEKVFFCGTPCQVEAINLLAGNSDNLITCDLICHGVCSTSVFNEYMGHCSKNRRIVDISFRDKTNGWSKFSVKTIFDDGGIKIQDRRRDSFMIGFLNNYYLRNSCYICKFSKIPRVSDITLGDYWGVRKELFDDRGVSVIIVNNNKGLDIIESLNISNRIHIVKVDLEHVIKNNTRLSNGPLKVPVLRNQFFDDLKNKGFHYVKRRYLKPVPILRIIASKIKKRIFSR